MKNTFLVALVILFVFNILLSYHIHNLKKEISHYNVFIATNNEILDKKSDDIKDLNESILNNLSINNEKLALNNIFISDKNGKIRPLAHLTSANGKILLYRIPKEICDPCVNRVLNEIRKAKILNEKLAILVSDKTLLEKNDYAHTSIGVKTYLLEYELPFDIDNKAYFFTVDSNGHTMDGYIPLEGNTAYIEHYINKIIEVIK